MVKTDPKNYEDAILSELYQIKIWKKSYPLSGEAEDTGENIWFKRFQNLCLKISTTFVNKGLEIRAKKSNYIEREKQANAIIIQENFRAKLCESFSYKSEVKKQLSEQDVIGLIIDILRDKTKVKYIESDVILLAFIAYIILEKGMITYCKFNDIKH